jgi:hypothetical protein
MTFIAKKYLQHIWRVATECYRKVFHLENKTQSVNTSFFSLSPTDQIENGQNYFDALNWALDKGNEKIKNIALTGSYGSGKSSVLQSFQKQNTNKDFHFLNISLATFKEEERDDDKNKLKKDNKTEGENLLRLIELSILQQLFYRETDSTLPDSRLKKIRNHTHVKRLCTTICCFLFLVSLLLLIKPNILSSLLPKADISDILKIFIHYFSLAICILGAGFIIFKSIRLFHNLKISQLNINNAEIEISSEINKSVLNHNLEELLYYQFNG